MNACAIVDGLIEIERSPRWPIYHRQIWGVALGRGDSRKAQKNQRAARFRVTPEHVIALLGER